MGEFETVRYFSAPGRVEIGGNHTDHQCGRVLAAAVELEMSAAVQQNIMNTVRLNNDFFGIDEVELQSLDARPAEVGTVASLIRGVAAWFIMNGHSIGGFDADVSSRIPIGAGLSSSAAFTVLIGNIFKSLYGADVSPIGIAQAGQFAENAYFGKPCGLMDQMASSFGGLNIIDFENPQNPAVTPVNANLSGYSMCVVNTGGSHADLTPDYAACTMEMKVVAKHFGKELLSEVRADEFYDSVGKLRHLGDRAVLRAIHFFGDNERVLKQAAALERGDIQEFFNLVIESGRSSLAYLQNVFSPSNPHEQGLTLALALAWRVHGGGFAGTILSFVPDDLKEAYGGQMDQVFGEGCCHFLGIRQKGGGEVVMQNAECI
jgi:galactokinase